ncbi:hypothetical protein D6D02_10572 [Aureobasidium pullulans]|uniref:Uncharacterized protein n=1 Tax=Aureobasidium pullulans TaxID=5580 RepID=A0A4S8V005_AURPU|nr:hypothetical protein D6D24_10575 [Aureobasidium pullulans]THX91615.1 hypothetical protein D6D02_10572 [Aureobasidium pullulans]THX93140.1 hypothetical protein D6D03_10194 [Aureobasidium pullulans]
MPQGYEDVNTYDELKARKKRLGVTGAAEHMALDDRIRRRVKISHGASNLGYVIYHGRPTDPFTSKTRHNSNAQLVTMPESDQRNFGGER